MAVGGGQLCFGCQTTLSRSIHDAEFSSGVYQKLGVGERISDEEKFRGGGVPDQFLDFDQVGPFPDQEQGLRPCCQSWSGLSTVTRFAVGCIGLMRKYYRPCLPKFWAHAREGRRRQDCRSPKPASPNACLLLRISL